MSFPETLVSLQKKNGESSYRLAKNLDVSEQSIANWRNGVRFPHPRNLKKLANHYCVTVEELLAGKEEYHEPRSCN